MTTLNTQATDQIIRHRNPVSETEPWAREFAEVIEISSGVEQVVLSGVGPQIADPEAQPDTFSAYGNTAVQTLSVLRQIERILNARGYSMGDIVLMQALLVAAPSGDGSADFAGFSEVYNQFFGTGEQPNVPARTRAQVVRLVPPGWLVEITVTACRVPSRSAS
jgi:enamine deaminase RidA (YjgF/YER057c/UK114 family)